MSELNRLSSLRTELQALPVRHRRAVLKALSPSERSQVLSLLEPERQPAPPPESDAGTQDNLLDAHSAPIAGRLQSAQAGAPPPGARWKMTPAAQAHLLVCAEALRDLRQGSRPPAAPRGRSLLGALGGWISAL